MMFKKIRVIISLSLVISLPALASQSAYAEVDPFPNVANGAEIPGTKLWSDPGVSQSTFEATAAYTNWIQTGCGAGAGTGIGVDLNFTTTNSDDRYYVVCVKTWRPQSDIDADAAFRTAQQTAQVEAEALSLAWNQAHPGQQKCFQWGPVVHANGVSTASGGVCANPVPVQTILETATVETVTVSSETSTPVQIQQTGSTQVPTVQTTGLGGYAIIHPDSHVCGVIVGTSSDPYNNGGTMPVEYMGCPVGSRIVFQTTPSETGNVAGWHGSNVTYDGSKFIITYGNSVTTITHGIATDGTGRVWNTGTGQVYRQGVTPTPVDTSTVRVETSTPVLETQTVLNAQTTLNSTILIVDTSTATFTPAAQDATNIDDLPEETPEEEITNSIEARIVNNKTRIEVSTGLPSTKLNIVATKKGSKKKYTYKITTNSQGDYIFKSSINLRGFTLVLLQSGVELDRTVVS